MKGHNHAIERSQIARKARPLGEKIVDLLRQKVSLPPRVPSVPKVGAHTRPKSRGSAHGRVRRADRTLEAPVLHECLAWLHAHGVFVWRNNTGTYWSGDRPISYGYPGSADIIGLLPGSGRFLAIECKSSIGKQSRKQLHFQEQVERDGGVYLLVRSVQNLEEQWAKLS